MAKRKDEFCEIKEGLIFSNKEVKDYLASGLMLTILNERHSDWVRQLEIETSKEIKGLTSRDLRIILSQMLQKRKMGTLKFIEIYKNKMIKKKQIIEGGKIKKIKRVRKKEEKRKKVKRQRKKEESKSK